MSLQDIRTAIATKLGAVANIGHVHTYQRYATNPKAFKDLYESNGKVLGWFIRRVSTATLEEATTYNVVVHRWRIEGLMSLDDSAASEIAFDDLIEAIRAAFLADDTIGDVVETTFVDSLAGMQLDDSGPAMFSGVLCHWARLSLATQVKEEIGIEAINDFAIGNVKWNQGPEPDANVDAEDNLQMEVAP